MLDDDLVFKALADPPRRLVHTYRFLFSDVMKDEGSFSTDQANLALVGWNDVITSFKSLNGGHPKFWENASYGTPSWQWAAGAWVSNVGSGANDKFSSLKNVP